MRSGSPASAARAAGDRGIAATSMACGGAAGAHHLGEIAGEPVRHVHRRLGVLAEGGRDGEARARMQVAVDESVLLVGAQARGPGRALAAPEREAERRVADCSGHAEAVAGLRAAARHHAPRRDLPERRDGQPQGAARPHRVAAQQGAAEGLGRLRQPLGEAGQPRLRPVVRQGQGEQEPARLRRLGGKVRDVHGERLAGDRLRPVVGEEVDAGRQPVDRENEVVPRRRPQAGGVVLQPEAALPRHGREEPGDQFILGRALTKSFHACRCRAPSCTVAGLSRSRCAPRA